MRLEGLLSTRYLPEISTLHFRLFWEAASNFAISSPVLIHLYRNWARSPPACISKIPFEIKREIFLFRAAGSPKVAASLGALSREFHSIIWLKTSDHWSSFLKSQIIFKFDKAFYCNVCSLQLGTSTTKGKYISEHKQKNHLQIVKGPDPDFWKMASTDQDEHNLLEILSLCCHLQSLSIWCCPFQAMLDLLHSKKCKFPKLHAFAGIVDYLTTDVKSIEHVLEYYAQPDTNPLIISSSFLPNLIHITLQLNAMVNSASCNIGDGDWDSYIWDQGEGNLQLASTTLPQTLKVFAVTMPRGWDSLPRGYLDGRIDERLIFVGNAMDDEPELFIFSETEMEDGALAGNSPKEASRLSTVSKFARSFLWPEDNVAGLVQRLVLGTVTMQENTLAEQADIQQILALCSNVEKLTIWVCPFQGLLDILHSTAPLFNQLVEFCGLVDLLSPTYKSMEFAYSGTGQPPVDHINIPNLTSSASFLPSLRQLSLRLESNAVGFELAGLIDLSHFKHLSRVMLTFAKDERPGRCFPVPNLPNYDWDNYFEDMGHEGLLDNVDSSPESLQVFVVYAPYPLEHFPPKMINDREKPDLFGKS
ncbi:hypothetical protein C8J56DRAFT_900541 [Mycena floridula]|nr:hypothetical protein C8J56DRAFT_900541 [Mycena floridula]